MLKKDIPHVIKQKKYIKELYKSNITPSYTTSCGLCASTLAYRFLVDSIKSKKMYK